MQSLLLSNLDGFAGSNAWMVILLIKATIILLTALGITLVMQQRFSAGARHVVWLVTVAALLLVPALTVWSPLPVPVLPAASAFDFSSPSTAPSVAADANESVLTGNPVIRADARTGDGSSISRTAAPEASGLAGMSVISIALLVWALVVLAIGGSLGFAALTVRRIVRRAQPLDSQDWLAPLWEVSDRLGLEEPPLVLRSGDAKMPFACGVMKPTIVLPAECDTWTLDRRRAVLLHELAHVKRHDLIGHTLGRLACAVYWFHPLVWTAAKNLRAESERACDDLAIACGARATDYAEHLLDIVTSVRRDATPSVALAMARRKEFEGRMLAILDPELRHSAPTRRQSAALVGSLAVIAVLIGAAAPAPRVAEAAANPVQQDEGDSLSSESDPAVDVNASAHASAAALANGEATLVPRVSTSTTFSTSTVVTESEFSRMSSGANRNALLELVKSPQGTGSDERPALLAKVLLSDPSDELRQIAAWGLHEYADMSVGADALATALRRDSNAGVREMAAWALHDADGSATAFDALVAALRGDASVQVRSIAAWTLGNIGEQSATEPLTAALSDASPLVRRRAVWALGHVEPKQAPRALFAMLRDSDPQVRELVAWALFRIEDPASIPALDAALRGESNKELQIAYIRALAAVGEQSVDALRSLLESKDPEIKKIAVRALAGGNATGPWPWPWPEPRPFPQ
jgi:beta-lactamase regulating signal transducer with metallopeptidase domain/HEAT repeat protein